MEKWMLISKPFVSQVCFHPFLATQCLSSSVILYASVLVPNSIYNRDLQSMSTGPNPAREAIFPALEDILPIMNQ